MSADFVALSPWTQAPGNPAQWVRLVEGGDPADSRAWRARAWRSVAVYDPDELLDEPHLPRDLGWRCCATSKARDGRDSCHRRWADRMLRRLGYVLPEDCKGAP